MHETRAKSSSLVMDNEVLQHCSPRGCTSGAMATAKDRPVLTLQLAALLTADWCRRMGEPSIWTLLAYSASFNLAPSCCPSATHLPAWSATGRPWQQRLPMCLPFVVQQRPCWPWQRCTALREPQVSIWKHSAPEGSPMMAEKTAPPEHLHRAWRSRY